MTLTGLVSFFVARQFERQWIKWIVKVDFPVLTAGIKSLVGLSTLHVYVASNVLRPVLGAVLIGLGILICARLLLVIDLALGRQSALSLIIKLIGYWIPHYTELALPVALFCGVYIGASRLAKNQELFVTQATGMSLHRLFIPTLLISVLVLIINLAISGWIQPLSVYGYRALKSSLSNQASFHVVSEGAFMRSGNHTYIVDNGKEAGSDFSRLFLYITEEDGSSLTLTAESGTIEHSGIASRPMMKLNTGASFNLQAQDNRSGPEGFPFALQSRTFDKLLTPIGPKTPHKYPKRGGNETEWTLDELIAGQISIDSNLDTIRVSGELHLRLAKLLIVLLIPIHALSFALARSRSNRPFGLGIAVVILICVFEVVTKGSIVSKQLHISPFITIWLPMVLFCVMTMMSYWRTCYRVPAS